MERTIQDIKSDNVGYRSIQKTSIILGFTQLPVGLVSVFSAKDSFKRLTPNGNTTIQKIFDSKTGEEVKVSECKSAYVLGKDDYVVIDRKLIKEEFKREAQGIRIEKFCSCVDIPPQLYEKHYWLVPDKKFKETKLMYSLIGKIMREKCVVAVATILMRDVMRNCIINCDSAGRLILTTLNDYSLFRDIRVETDKDFEKQHIALMEQTIGSMTQEIELWKGQLPDKYLERVREAVIDTKEKGREQALAIRVERNKLQEKLDNSETHREIALEIVSEGKKRK